MFNLKEYKVDCSNKKKKDFLFVFLTASTPCYYGQKNISMKVQEVICTSVDSFANFWPTAGQMQHVGDGG
jgi:hypothetical protein